MKHYAKKREPVRAVQWTGELTSEMSELLGPRDISVNGDRQLIFGNAKGPGRFARIGNWMVSSSGEDLTVIGDDVFRRDYEVVDESGRRLPPTDDQHDAAAREFVRELNVLLCTGLKLSPEDHPDIFRERERLVHTLAGLFVDQSYIAARKERDRIRNLIIEETKP